MPICRARASTKALKVDPPWKPALPPIAKLTLVWPLPVPYGRSTAMARTAPVPGSTTSDTANSCDGSVAGTLSSTARWAARCTPGSSVVRMVRPPDSSRC